ncbi:hypothetical protein [Halosolutus halophilus]|uniref:hypothetical protein n=1 Tax=Halosolutus halophilus TaxID=1552990 RepID=UPI002234FF35|nr:hypothetical protein [Halosolutus halophilus]
MATPVSGVAAMAVALTLAQQLEQYVSLGIFLLGSTLAALSFLAWRRERDRRMFVVTVGYLMFALYGLIVFLEYYLLPYFTFRTVELLEHGAALLILAGLLAFFVALARN